MYNENDDCDFIHVSVCFKCMCLSVELSDLSLKSLKL